MLQVLQHTPRFVVGDALETSTTKMQSKPSKLNRVDSVRVQIVKGDDKSIFVLIMSHDTFIYYSRLGKDTTIRSCGMFQYVF